MGLETAAIVATVASTVISGVSSMQQSKAASAAAGYNAQVSAQNAELATRNANYAAAQGEQNVAAEAAKTRALIGATLANQGASGVEVGSGSAVNVRQSEAKLGMLNALNVRSQAAREAYGFQTQAVNDLAQSRLDKMKQKSIKTSGYLDAGATILGGAGKSFSQYGDFLSKNDPVGLTAADNNFLELAQNTAVGSGGY